MSGRTAPVPMARRSTVALSLAIGALASHPVLGAETDPYYAWLHPPRDASPMLDRMVNARLARGLSEINRQASRARITCRDAAATMASTLGDTAMHFVWGGVRSWDVWRSPQTRTEYEDVFRRESVYRYALLFPVGSMVPLDPAVRVGDVLLGTDKIGHFFTNGLRYFDRYLEVLATGVGEREAVRAAVMVGVLEEANRLGMGVSGIFSYADLHANDRGFAFYRALCEGPEPELVFDGGRWALRAAFSFERWVDPCWDEGWNPSAFAAREAPPVRRAIEELCPRWRHPRVQERRARYRAMACTSDSAPVLEELIARALIPDPGPWNADSICGMRSTAPAVPP